jgi:hypothetical protein
MLQWSIFRRGPEEAMPTQGTAAIEIIKGPSANVEEPDKDL